MGKTVAVMLGRGSLAHNNRVFSTGNVNPALTSDNIIFVQQKLRDAYQEIFGETLEQYNQKQKRNDRKIPDYYEHIRQSKNGEKLYHELVVQVGNRSDTGIGSADTDIAKEILTRYYHDFKERNPNMRVFNAVLHMDEADGTPHLHIDFIPVATGQKRSLEIKNSMRQALQQQGFDYQPIPVPDENTHVSYGKPQPKIGGGRWLESERAYLGSVLEQQGISWDRQGTHREHLSVSEYKACAEIISREIHNTHPAELKSREPNTAMKLAGVKADEIIVTRASVEAVQQENMELRAQAEINRKAIQSIDNEKRSSDVFIQRVIKTASEQERRAAASATLVRQEAEDEKARYSPGTAEKYRELSGAYVHLNGRYTNLEQEKTRIASSIPQQIKNAVEEATAPLEAENNRLHIELERWKKIAAVLQARVRSLAQTLHDAMRAIFTLKYNFSDKRHNPYKSDLPETANHLIDALEQKSRAAFRDAGFTELENGMGGMGVTLELEREVQKRLPKPKQRGYEISS